MKFGKKKKTDAPGNDSRARPFSLMRIPLLQSALVLAGVAVLTWLLTTFVMAPTEQRVLEANTRDRVDGLKSRFDQHLSYLHDIVAGYAAQQTTFEAARGGGKQEVARVLQDTLPSARAVFLFAPDEVTQPEGRDYELSFASIDLARQAERSGENQMDAYQRDGEWLVQIAAPVKTGEDGRKGGSLLVIFEASVMDPVIAAATEAIDGRVELRQRVDNRDVTIVSSGQAGGEGVARDLAVDRWSVRYASTAQPPELFPLMTVWGMALGIALVVIAGLWAVFMTLQKQLRNDVSGLSQWAQKAFGGERVKLPALRLPATIALAETLSRLAREAPVRTGRGAAATKKPAAKKRQAAPEEEAAPAEPDSEEGGDNDPLFDDDALDIEMMNGDEDVLGLEGGSDAGEMTLEETAPLMTEVPDSIFRAYDIRGVVGDTLTPDIVRVIGQAIGSEGIQRGQQQICVGYDGRHSSPELAEALSQGLMQAGMDVVRVGRVPTPVLYFAAHYLENGSGVMITGSHNPPEYNGLKMVLGGETLAGDAIQKLLERIRNQQLEEGSGQQTEQDVRKAYIDRIVGDIAVATPLRVVVDAGNGVAGELGPQLIQELGCEVTPLFCDVDGDFPNHHPDPGKPENLETLIQTVRDQGADLGIAFDGDGDRLGVVTNSGKIIWPDRLLMLFARDVVSRNPGADIIYDVKCSRRLATVINEYGGRPIMWKTGHSWIKAKMKSEGALLAGEMSGHIFFQERWYGFDDGIYAAARLLEILGTEDREADAVFAEFPEDESTPEINLPVPDDAKFALIERLANDGDFGDATITDIDGIRVDYPDGWGLCRASNTTPNLVLRFEAESIEGLERIKAIFRDQLQKAEPSLTISF
ncbi:phosphomannomutase [Halospina denitrificans]|uniref:phosphomannomutase n=1 Tax=Halospina denitrificans TaxID=332522 RepID=A0A4R7JQ93_9GAMM|nr:phosphomannomutase/phosphoglucomutase [Halospina denitrificans]TDT40300.1 phosphomannomutase [Halospina denitrificans]